MSIKLKPKEIKLWKSQNWTGSCDLCKEPLALEEAVADHDHRSGLMRGVLHRKCNSLEGVISRGLTRFGFKHIPKNFTFLIEYYEKAALKDPVLHPTYLSPEEKNEKRKLRAKRARAKRTRA